jgi:hypothetical protein
MFNHAVTGRPSPKHVSTDHDPLFRFHRWLANLRVREIEEVKSVPYAPVSHPFVERLIGTIWKHSGITTTAIACIARSPVSRQRSVPAHCVPRPRYWVTTAGSGTARACSSSRSPLDYDLATDRPNCMRGEAGEPGNLAGVAEGHRASRSPTEALYEDDTDRDPRPR